MADFDRFDIVGAWWQAHKRLGSIGERSESELAEFFERIRFRPSLTLSKGGLESENQIEIYDDLMARELRERVEWEWEYVDALEDEDEGMIMVWATFPDEETAAWARLMIQSLDGRHLERDGEFVYCIAGLGAIDELREDGWSAREV